MFPAQTSFIPVTVAIVKYIEAHGFLGDYPFWYLGTTPVKYLVGPVVPTILIALHEFLPNFSLFDISYFLILASFIISAVGWGMFARRISGNRSVGWWVGFLSLFLPWRFFSIAVFGEVSAVLANSLTPWVLLAFEWGPVGRFPPPSALSSSKLSQDKDGFVKLIVFRFKKLLASCALWGPFFDRHPSAMIICTKPVALTIFLFTFLLLTNSTASIPAIVGIFILAIVKAKKWEQGVKQAALVVFVGWLLTAFWYGFEYWVGIFFKTPSIGGKSVLGVVVSLLNSLRAFLPVTLAIVLVRFKFKPKNLYEKFVFSWLGVFVSITLFRFVADVDFWMDWTSWMGEIEIGIVLLVSKFFSQSFAFKTASKTKRTFVLFLLTYLIVGWWLVWTNRGFWMPRKSVEGTVEYILAKDLERIVGPGETVFLSGSTAFWLNSLVDVAQVRGGRDEVSQNENWRKVVWEVRGGVGKNRSVESLKLLGVDFLVVHGDNSSEYYHDFENPQGFEGLDSLEKVYDDAQDRIYKIK